MSDMQRRREAARQAEGDTDAIVRLHRCRRERDHRGDLWWCNRPPCPDCGERTGNRFAQRTVLPLVRVARPCGYFFYLVTVVLPPDLDIDRAGNRLDWAKRAIKDRLQRLADRHPTLAGWWLAGGYEMDMVRDHQFALLGLGKQGTLSPLGFPHGEFGAAVWLPHLHFLLAVPPGGDAGLVRAELSGLFPATRQVDMRPVRGNGADEKGVRRLTRYPHKHLLRLALPRYRGPESWDAEEVTTYALWAERFSSQGYRGFRFGAGDRRFLALVEAALDAEDEDERRAVREMMAEDEWLYGPGSGSLDDHDVDAELRDAAILRCDGDDDRGICPSSSSGGVNTTRPAAPRPRMTFGARAADRALEMQDGFPPDGRATETGCRGPPLRDCPG